MNERNMSVEVVDIVKRYNDINVVNEVSFSMETGEQIALTGASGSGKSTLLYLLGGLDKPSDGIVKINGHDINEFDDESLAIFRNRFVGFVFQFHFLLSSMNGISNILLPARIGGVKTKEVEVLVNDLAAELKVEHCLKKFPYQLSGGEQQRINIIRALSLRPKLLLCDEPTGNLDSKNSDLVSGLLIDLAKEFNSTLVVVTHDGNIAKKFENQLVLEDGKLLQ